jgi:hypothetical protein
MKRLLSSLPFRSLILVTLAAGGALTWGAPHPVAAPGILLETMQAELERAKTSLAKSDPAPYFISYEVYDQHSLQIAGTYGTLVSSSETTRRWADVTMRVGSPVLDNTHNENRASGITSGPLPLADDRDAIGNDQSRISPGDAGLFESRQQFCGAGGGRRQISRFFNRDFANTDRQARGSDCL